MTPYNPLPVNVLRYEVWPPPKYQVPEKVANAPEGDLLSWVLGKDEQLKQLAWEELHNRYRHNVWQQIKKGAIYDDDVAKDIYCRVWNITTAKLLGDKVWEGTSIGGWLYEVTKRQLSNHRKQISRREQNLEKCRQLVKISGSSAEDEFSDHYDKLLLMKAISRLKNHDQQEMIILRYIKGWPINQIAQKFNKPPNTISQTIKRTLKQLLSILQALENERL